ncbi:hypothetical protein TNCV_3692021 [Trichonephila clavipes]|nr:hypothetical protein TNCV_3692021 [Trichonephila clavipes]
MPNSPTKMIPDMLDWTPIWGSDRPREGSKNTETFLRPTPLPCEAEHCLVEKWLLGAVASLENTCGGGMPWTYCGVVIVPRINTRCDSVL